MPSSCSRRRGLRVCEITSLIRLLIAKFPPIDSKHDLEAEMTIGRSERKTSHFHPCFQRAGSPCDEFEARRADQTPTTVLEFFHKL